MDSFLSAAVLWFIIGFIFFLLEFAIPGFILFFFGLGAWVAALASLMGDISINLQLAIFLGTSILTVLLFRNWVKNKLGMMRASSETLPDEIIGKTATAETNISSGHQGKVYFRGASWQATSEDQIEPGETVQIIGNESIILFVKSTKSL